MQGEASGLHELEAPPPDQNTHLEKHESQSQNHTTPQSHYDGADRQDEEEEIGLDELEAAPPDQNPNDDEIYHHESLERERSREREEQASIRSEKTAAASAAARQESRALSQLFVHSHLIFFSLFGVLARLGLVALTAYPGAPLATTVVWANVAGSLVIGFLREDRMLFRRHWHAAVEKTRSKSSESEVDTSAAHETFIASRSTMHGFIGLTVGFCGTFTSFADIIRDAFFAISNDLDTAHISSSPSTMLQGDEFRTRDDGYSVLAVIAVLWIEVSMSLAALEVGAHLAIATQRLADVIPTSSRSLEPTINYVVVVLGWGCWIGAILMIVFPPHEAWRGQVTFALVFAPLGAMLRFWLAKLLNPRLKSFPLGTFAANVFGTCVLGMVLDLQRSGYGAPLISCQVLTGVGDGFCGGLTTVSTWVLELKALRLKHAYLYAFTSLAIPLACMVTIMGSLRWTQGFEMVTCEA